MSNHLGLIIFVVFVVVAGLIVANWETPMETQAGPVAAHPDSTLRGEPMRKAAPEESTDPAAVAVPVGTMADTLPNTTITTPDAVPSKVDAPTPFVDAADAATTPVVGDEVPAESSTAAPTGPRFVTFKEVSSFKYSEPDPGKPDSLKKGQVPAEVLALSGQRVTMEGYLIPLDIEPGDRRLAKTFFLAPNQLACCFGQLPEINEVVELRFEKPVKIISDVLVRATGVFEIGEQFDEYGYLMSLYRMQGESIEDPWQR